MAKKLPIIFGSLALAALIGLTMAKEYNEEQLVNMLFAEQPAPVGPIWASIYLWKLKDIYDAKKDGLSKEEKERSSIVDQMCEYSDVKDNKCNDEHLKRLQESIIYIAKQRMPNIRVYLRHFFLEQLELCMTLDKNFKFTKLDNPIIWTTRDVWAGGLDAFYNP